MQKHASHVTIAIQSKEEAAQGAQLWADLNKGATIANGRLTRVGILEGGTEAGKTSVALLVEVPMGMDPKTKEPIVMHVISQITAAAFQGIAGAVRGAQARFGDLEKTEPKHPNPDLN